MERERLRRFLKGLKADDYLIVALFFVERLTIEEIRYITGKGEDEIEKTVNKTLKEVSDEICINDISVSGSSWIQCR